MLSCIAAVQIFSVAGIADTMAIGAFLQALPDLRKISIIVALLCMLNGAQYLDGRAVRR